MERTDVYKEKSTGRHVGLAVLSGIDVREAHAVLSSEPQARATRATSKEMAAPIWAPFASTSGFDVSLWYTVPRLDVPDGAERQRLCGQ